MSELQSVFTYNSNKILKTNLMCFFEFVRMLMKSLHLAKGNICMLTRKALSKEIMQKTRLRKRFFKKPYAINKKSYDKQRNLCVSLLWKKDNILQILILSWWRPLSYRNQPIDLFCKSMDWFLYDNSLCHERVKENRISDNKKIWRTIKLFFLINLGIQKESL